MYLFILETSFFIPFGCKYIIAFFQLNLNMEKILHKFDLFTIMPAMLWANQELIKEKKQNIYYFS